MAENFYTMLTIVGKNKLSSSAISGNQVNFKTLKVGDGKGAYYEPSENQTSLVNKVWEGNISSISIDENNSNWIVVETVIPASDGGFFIREAGIFDEDGDMIAISKLAETYKPVVSEGSTKDLVIKIVLEVLNVNTVTMKIDPNVVAATKHDVQVLESKLEDLKKDISNDIVITPEVTYGMNNVIKNDGTVSISPKFTIQGKTVINLLGKDGNCEDVSKFSVWQGTVSLDSTNKVFGVNGIKTTISSSYTNANFYQNVQSIIGGMSKYYCLSAYIKNGNATSIALKYWKDNAEIKTSDAITNITNFTRVFIKLSYSDIGTTKSEIGTVVNGGSGQYGYVDGIMLEEITSAQYNDPNFQPSPYVDSYACLQNPYIEVRHDNLVRNGNGEEGIAWWTPINSNDASISVYNNKFRLVGTQAFSGINSALIPVKPNTNYYLKYNCSGGEIYVNPPDSYSSITGGVTSFNTGSLTSIRLGISCAGTAGTYDFDSIMLVEGTTAPISYKPCRVERVVLETKLTSDDSITYENGEVTGLINWKHKTLYGKDYDWQYLDDETAYKRIKYPAMSNISSQMVCTKYDGKILTFGQDTYYGTDRMSIDGSNISVSDADTGWSESFNPSNDAIKAYMNGWKAVSYLNSYFDYDGWVSIINPNLKVGSIKPVSASTNYSLLTGTVMGAFDNNGGLCHSVSGVTSGILTMDLGANSPQVITKYGMSPQGGYPTRMPKNWTFEGSNDNSVWNVLDTQSNVTSWGSLVQNMRCFTINNSTAYRYYRLNITANNGDSYLVIACIELFNNIGDINYVSKNIAQGYEGYQLHYRLNQPESITDDNYHVHGDVPKFDVGDNYLYLDSGMVLGEVANPYNDGINCVIDRTGTNSRLRYLWSQSALGIYKNGAYDSKWSTGTALDLNWWGTYWTMPSSNFDTSATYTVDYKILATIAPQIGSIDCSYSQDISTSINNLQEEVNNRQAHDSILDEIVDASIYEVLNIGGNMIIPWAKTSNGLYFDINYPLSAKKTTPVITVNNLVVYSNSYNITKSVILIPQTIYITRNYIHYQYVITDSSVINSVMSYGIYLDATIIADCRGRI